MPAAFQGEPEAAGGVDTGGVVDKVGHKSALLNLAVGELAGELVDDGADHLQVSQLFGADVGEQCLELGVGHGIALAEVAKRSTEFAVWTSLLQ